MKGTIVTKMLCLILCMITVWVKKKTEERTTQYMASVKHLDVKEQNYRKVGDIQFKLG